MYEFIRVLGIIGSTAMLALLVVIAVAGNSWAISKKLYYQIVAIMFVSFLVYVFCLELKLNSRWDLLMHYQTLAKIRAGGWEYLWTEGEYSSLYITSLYFYLISLLPGDRLLPVIPLIVDFSVFLYVFNDSMRIYDDQENYPVSDAAFTTLAWLSTFGLKLSVMGVRCVLAVSVCFLGIYLEAIKGTHKKTGMFCYFLAIGIHDFPMILIGIRLLMFIKNKKLLAIGAAGVMLSVTTVAPILYKAVSNSSLRSILKKVLRYSGDDCFSRMRRVDGASMTVILCFLVVIAFFALMNLKVSEILRIKGKNADKRNRLEQRKLAHSHLTDDQQKECSQIMSFTSTLSIMLCAFTMIYVMTERGMYLLAYGLVMLIPYYRKMRLDNFIINTGMLAVMLWMWFFNDVYILMSNEIGFYFLAK